MTFVAWDPAASRHDLAGHPENHRRAESILSAFDADPVLGRLPRLSPDRAVERDEALRVHTPRLWLNLEQAEADGTPWLDPDTYMVRGSFDVARRAARLCVQAVERCLRTGERGFVVARPPGHHATRDRSMGFCLLNNVAIAAATARAMGARRVLVLDHDVHHGNGTQDVFYESPDVLYQSFHLFPHYPGTGRAEEVGTGPGTGFTVNAPLVVGDGDPEVRSLLVNVLLPIAKQFQPSLILVSAGFDSLAGDPLGGLEISTPFFGEIVERLIAICPKVLCVLEGGYQLDRIPLAAMEELQVLAGTQTRLGTDVRPPACEARLRTLHRDRCASLR